VEYIRALERCKKVKNYDQAGIRSNESPASILSRTNGQFAFRDVTGKSIWKERLREQQLFFHENQQQTPQGFPSETNVKRGFRVVHGEKELLEKLGRNDPCLCGSGRTFQEVLHADRSV